MADVPVLDNEGLVQKRLGDYELTLRHAEYKAVVVKNVEAIVGQLVRKGRALNDAERKRNGEIQWAAARKILGELPLTRRIVQAYRDGKGGPIRGYRVLDDAAAERSIIRHIRDVLYNHPKFMQSTTTPRSATPTRNQQSDPGRIAEERQRQSSVGSSARDQARDAAGEVGRLKILQPGERAMNAGGHWLCKVKGCDKQGRRDIDDMCKRHYRMFSEAGRGTSDSPPPIAPRKSPPVHQLLGNSPSKRNVSPCPSAKKPSEEAPPKKKRKSKSLPYEKKRSDSAYQLFIKDYHKKKKAAGGPNKDYSDLGLDPNAPGATMKVVAAAWKKVSNEERERYDEKAAGLKRRATSKTHADDADIENEEDSHIPSAPKESSVITHYPQDESPGMDWKDMWRLMRKAGWKYMNGNGMIAWIWVHPSAAKLGKNELLSKREEGVHYFTSEPDVQRYAARHLGWKGGARVTKRNQDNTLFKVGDRVSATIRAWKGAYYPGEISGVKARTGASASSYLYDVLFDDNDKQTVLAGDVKPLNKGKVLRLRAPAKSAKANEQPVGTGAGHGAGTGKATGQTASSGANASARSQRSNPSRFAKEKNVTDMAFKENMWGFLPSVWGKTVRWHDVNGAFRPDKLDAKQLRKNVGQYLAKCYLESSSGWVVRVAGEAGATGEGIEYVVYKDCKVGCPNDFASAREGDRKFTGYEALAKWAYENGAYERDVVSNVQGATFLEELGINGDPYSIFREEASGSAGERSQKNGGADAVLHGSQNSEQNDGQPPAKRAKLRANSKDGDSEVEVVEAREVEVQIIKQEPDAESIAHFNIIHGSNEEGRVEVPYPSDSDPASITFAAVRAQIDEDELFAFSFRFVMRGGGSPSPKQEGKWSASEKGLSTKDGERQDGTLEHPFRIHIKRDGSEAATRSASQADSRPPASAAELRGRGVLLECDHLKVILPRMARMFKLDIADVNFFTRLVHSEEEWVQTRRHLLPGPQDTWTSLNEEEFTTASTHAPMLMVPVHMPGPPPHFVGVIRFQAPRDSLFDWDFAFIDSCDKDVYFEEAQKRIDNHTTLANRPGDISNDTPVSSQRSARWTRVSCVKQSELECGCRMILHFYIAAFSGGLDDFEQKIRKLDEVENLPSRARDWAVDWLENNIDFDREPKWLKNVREGGEEV